MRLHVAKREGRLEGATPEERFALAGAELGDGAALGKLLHDFPVLDRSLGVAATAAGSARAEMLVRLAADSPALRAVMGQADSPDRLVGVGASLGDTHNGGRTVMRVQFASALELFYKPRPLAVDAHVQGLITWLVDRGLDPAPGVTAVIDRGAHGWMEVATAAPCRSVAEVKAFYRRQGGLLLVLYLLDGSDMHSENLIAARKFPCWWTSRRCSRPVRAPMAAPPRWARRSGTTSFSAPCSFRGAAPAPWPESTWVVSGLPGKRHLAWRRRHRDTDTMRVVHEEGELAGDQNVPHLEGRPMNAADHVDEIVTGFADAYRLALRVRDDLLAPDGPIYAFGADRVRHVLRGTEEYAILLRGSYHPSCLRDAVERGFVFDTLWLGTAGHPELERVDRLRAGGSARGDVPYFTAAVGSRDLVDSKGRVIEDYLATSGLSRVVDRIEAMSEADLLRQSACIRGRFAAGSPPVPAPAPSAAIPFRRRPLRS